MTSSDHQTRGRTEWRRWRFVAVVGVAVATYGLAFLFLPAGRLSPSLYVSLHTLAEVLAALVGFAIFAVHWHAAAARALRDPRALFLGACFLGVAAVGILHTMAVPGMPGLIDAGSTERGIIYWLAARAWLVLGLLAAATIDPAQPSRWARRFPLLALNLSLPVAAILFDSSDVWHGLFFREDVGLTPLKVGLEYGLAALAALAGLLYFRQYRSTGERVHLALAAALVLAVLAELCLTLYSDAQDAFNLLGHAFNVGSFYLIFDGLFVDALVRPYARLDAARTELADSNRELDALRRHVEGELAETIRRLEDLTTAERAARRAAEAASERLTSLHSITEAALAPKAVESLYEEVLRRVRAALGADEATLLLLDEDDQTLRPRASVGLPVAGEAAEAVPHGRGLAGRAASSRSPVVVEDAGAEDLYRPAMRALASLIAAPLILDGRVIGVIHVGTTARRLFPPADVQLLQVIADRVASAIERARLYAELDAAIAAVPHGILLYSHTGRILRMNTAATHILRYDDDLRALPLAERLRAVRLERPDGSAVPVDESPVARALRGERIEGDLMRIHPRDGGTAWLSLAAAPVRGADGHLLGAVVSITDVTALREMEEQREDLLRSVSHDLRTPLTAIQLQAHRLQRILPPDDARGRRSADAIAGASDRMNGMIQDLVDSARFSAGNLRMEMRAVELPALIGELLAHSAGALGGSRVRVAIPADLPPVHADPVRLERVVANLLTNALKYSPPDSPVEVAAQLAGDAVELSVRDHGAGIPADELSSVFDRFFRARGASGLEGVGMGLYITRILVEAQGGTIRAESTPGEGSTFTVVLQPAVSLARAASTPRAR